MSFLCTAVPTGKKSILVMDDSAVLCCAYRQMLQAWGYDVDVAEDGLAGLACLRAAPARYHLVLSDYEMPRCNGIEFLQRFRSEIDTTAKTPCILITGTPLHQLSGRLGGFAHTLTKPFDLEHFKRILEATLLINNDY